MQLSSNAHIPDGLLAEIALLSEKPHQGVPSWNLALHQGIDERNSTAAIGLRAGQHLNRAWSRYTGKERDAESGLDNFDFRYYASSMGRFMSPDDGDGGSSSPGNPQSWNLYAYVQNNPLTNVDPDGHDCVVQSRIDDKSESVSVSSGDCSGVKTGSGQSATYVPGTVTGITSNGGNSIDIGYNSYDGQSSGVTNANSAPAFDHPGIDGPANAAIFGRIGNQGMGAIKAFTIGSVVGGALGAGGLAVAGYASAATVPSIIAPLLPAVPSAIEKLQRIGVSLQQANQILNDPAVQHVVDNVNGGNINSYTTISGHIIRITTDPAGQRIISAGIVQGRNIAAGLSSGRFTPAP
jgi:RHS repeat-associated protein